ncbi:hypothetical protein BDDG_13943, partial [Blastomyces dermatitidis ATCC 18188]
SSISERVMQHEKAATLKSLHEICFYQKSENLIFLKIIFTHLVCEINERNHQFQCSALNVIQVTAEFTLTTLFK